MKTIKLEFLERPVDAEINEKEGKFGDPRHYGPHRGVDYKAYLRDVKAIEVGLVVFSDKLNGTEQKGNYGNTVVIDHTPVAKKNQRHIYSLYAHLDKRSMSRGQEVKKGEVIGVSGNTGTTWYYKGVKRGFHLHFEIIDTGDTKKISDWSKGWPGNLDSQDRKDPMKGYLGQSKTVEYPLTEEEINKIRDSVDAVPVIDWKRGTCRVDWHVGGKKKGSTDKQNKEIDLKLTAEVVEEILRNSTPPRRKPEDLAYEIKI